MIWYGRTQKGPLYDTRRRSRSKVTQQRKVVLCSPRCTNPHDPVTLIIEASFPMTFSFCAAICAIDPCTAHERTGRAACRAGCKAKGRQCGSSRSSVFLLDRMLGACANILTQALLDTLNESQGAVERELSKTYTQKHHIPRVGDRDRMKPVFGTGGRSTPIYSRSSSMNLTGEGCR